MEINILKRDPVYLQHGKRYIFTYQLDGKPKKHKIDMYYISINGTSKFVFNGDENSLNIHFDTSEKRNQFIEEIKLWQAGGSYRKTHPIAKSRLDELKEEKDKLNKRIEDIETEMDKERKRETKQKVAEYNNDIDKESLQNIKDQLISLVNGTHTRYSIKPYVYWGRSCLALFDKTCNKYRLKIDFYADDYINFSELSEEEIRYLL